MKQIEQEGKRSPKVTGKDLLLAMNCLKDEWIEAEQEKSESKAMAKQAFKKPIGRSAVKWAAAAAAAVLFLGGGVAYAAVNLGVFQFTSSESENKPGYNLKVETERVSAKELTGGITEVKDFLLEQMSREDYRQTYPSWLKAYETLEEARSYIGYAGLKETMSFGEPKSIALRVIGDTEGNLGEVALFVAYQVGDIRLEETSKLYTTECPFEYHAAGIEHVEESVWKESYRKEEYTTKSGKNAVLVFEEYEDSIMSVEGFLTDGAVFYNLRILLEYQTNPEPAKKLLYQWLEQF